MKRGESREERKENGWILILGVFLLYRCVVVVLSC